MSTTKESEVEADGYELKLSGRDYLREQNVAHQKTLDVQLE